MQLEEDEKKDLKPHWKAGAIVLGIVVVITGIMMARGRSGAGPTQDGIMDPALFGDSSEADAGAAATGTGAGPGVGANVGPTPPDLSANNCEDPLTKCTSNCEVLASEVGSCDWQLVGGSTATPVDAVKTFAAGLKRIQEQAQQAEEEVDQAYLFDQFINYYKKQLSSKERDNLRNIRATSQDPFQQKAVDILLRD